MRFANTILVTVLYTTHQCYAFSPIPKYQKVSAANFFTANGDKKIAIESNARGRVDVHQYITSSNNDNGIDDINNNEYQSLKGAAASIILGTVTATQLGVGLASATYIDTVDVHQAATSTISDASVVVNKQQQSVSPFNKEDSALDSSINHFLLAADADSDTTATLEKKDETTTAKQKVDDAERKLEEVAAKQKAEAAAKKKADEAKKAAAEEAAAKKKVEEQKIADQKAKDEAAAEAKQETAKPKESSTTKSTTEEQTLLKEGDELIKDKIERIAATKQAQEAEEQLLKEKQDKIDKLYAEQKARTSTITKLKTAQEQAIQQKLTNQQTELNKRTELTKLLSNAEQYRINTAEQTRLIELDIKLNQLELVAYEERIETIQEQVNKLERLNDDTRIILKKLGVKGDDEDKTVEPKKVTSARASSSLSVKPKTTSSISGLSSSGSSTDESSTSSDLSPTALGVISVFITAGTVAGAYFFNDNDETIDGGGMINDPMGGGFGNTSGGDPSFPPPQGGGGLNENGFGNSAGTSFPPSQSNNAQDNVFGGGASGFQPPAMKGQEQSNNNPSFGSMKGAQSTPSTGFGASSSSPPQSAGFGQQGGGMNKTSFGNSSAFGNKGSTDSSSPLQSGGTPSFGQPQGSGFGNSSPANTMNGPQSTSNKGFGQQKSTGIGSPGSMKGSTYSAPAFGNSGGFVSKRDSMKGGETKQQNGGTPSFNSSSTLGGDKKQNGGTPSFSSPSISLKGQGGASKSTVGSSAFPSGGTSFGGVNMMKGKETATGKQSSFGSSSSSFGSPADKGNKQPGGLGTMKGPPVTVEKGKGAGSGFTTLDKKSSPSSSQASGFGTGGMMKGTSSAGKDSSTSAPLYGSKGGFVSKRDSMKASTDSTTEKKGGFSSSIGSTAKVQSGVGSGSFGSPKGGIDSKKKSSVGSSAFPSGGTSFGGVNMMKGKEADSTIDKKSNSFTMKNTSKSTQPGGLGNAKGAGSGFTTLDKKSSSSPGSGLDSKKTNESVGFGSGGMMKGTASSPFAGSDKSSTGPGMIKDSSSPFKMGSSTEKGVFGSPQKGKEGVDTKMSKKSSVGSSAFPSGGTSFGGVNMMKGKEAVSSPGKKSFGSSPAFGKKISDKGITSPMDKKSPSSFTMKGSVDSSKSGGMKMDSSSPFKMGDKASLGSPEGKGGVSPDTKMGKKSSVGSSAFPSGGTSFGGVNMMKGKEAGMPGVKSVQSTATNKSFGNSPAFGGKKMGDKSITSPTMDGKKSAGAFTMKGSVDSNKMSPPKSTFGSSPKMMNKASFGSGTPPKSMDNKALSMKGLMDNKQSSFGSGTQSKSFGTTSSMDNKMKSGIGGGGMKGGLGSDMKGSASKQPGGMNGMPPMKGGIGGPMKGMDIKKPGNLGGSNMPPSKGIGGPTAKKGTDNKQPGVAMPPPNKTFGSSPMDGKKSSGSIGGPNKTMVVNVKGRNISMSPPSASMDSKMSSPGSMGNGPNKTSTMKGATGSGSSAFGANGMSPSQPKLGQKSNTMGQQSAVMKGQSSGPGPSFNKSPVSPTSPNNKAFGTASINSQMLDGFSPVPESALGSSSQGFSKQSVSSFRDGGASNQAESYRASNEMGNSGSYDNSYQGYDNSIDKYGSSQGYDNSMNSSYDQGGSSSMGQDYYTDDYYTDDYSSNNSMRDFRDG